MGTPGKQKSSKRLWKDLFERKDLQRPLFVPLVYRYASRISGVAVEEMLSNATSLSRSLATAQELFGYDGIISNYDPRLEVELLGRALEQAPHEVTSRLQLTERPAAVIDGAAHSPSAMALASVIFDATAQLCDTVGHDNPVIGVLNSPVTLAQRMLGDAFDLREEHRQGLREIFDLVEKVVLDLLKTYCNQRVNGIWLIEENWEGISNEGAAWLKSRYQTLWNVAQYFDVPAIMAFHSYDVSELEKYFTLGADAVFFGGPRAFDVPLKSLSSYMEQYSVCAGVACPYPDSPANTASLESIIAYVAEAGCCFFLSTPSEVSLDTPVELLNAIMERIKD
jgi:hypothetical protein